VKQIRKRLTYANVMSSMAVFLVLGGATAIAAKQVLPKKSVGAKQLKSNAVTTAKIKKNAVTKAKIKNGSVDGSKIADGSVSGADLSADTNQSFSHVVARIRGTAGVPWTSGTVYPLNNPTYTQAAGQNNQFIGAVDVTFSASCTQPRSATAYLLVNAADPTRPTANDLAGLGVVSDTGAGTVTKRAEFVPFAGGTGMSRFAPGADTPHTFSILLVSPSCTAGSGVTASAAGIDVIGTK
jgi:hypothetical protein